MPLGGEKTTRVVVENKLARPSKHPMTQWIPQKQTEKEFDRPHLSAASVFQGAVEISWLFNHVADLTLFVVGENPSFRDYVAVARAGDVIVVVGRPGKVLKQRNIYQVLVVGFAVGTGVLMRAMGTCYFLCQ